MRHEIVKRVRHQLQDALDREDYTSVTVVGHSFGTVVAVDLLADLPPQETRFRLITLGALVELLAKRAPWLDQEVKRLVERPDLVEWIDVISSSDWFASGSGAPPKGRWREVKTVSRGTFVDKLAARTHASYFDNQKAVRVILDTDPES